MMGSVFNQTASDKSVLPNTHVFMTICLLQPMVAHA